MRERFRFFDASVNGTYDWKAWPYEWAAQVTRPRVQFRMTASLFNISFHISGTKRPFIYAWVYFWQFEYIAELNRVSLCSSFFQALLGIIYFCGQIEICWRNGFDKMARRKKKKQIETNLGKLWWKLWLNRVIWHNNSKLESFFLRKKQGEGKRSNALWQHKLVLSFSRK